MFMQITTEASKPSEAKIIRTEEEGKKKTEKLRITVGNSNTTLTVFYRISRQKISKRLE